jgi:hypothetical protein
VIIGIHRDETSLKGEKSETRVVYSSLRYILRALLPREWEFAMREHVVRGEIVSLT